MVNVTTANLFALATSLPYADQLLSLSSASTVTNAVQFVSYNRTFEADILGPDASTELLANETWQAFHEAGVYYKATNSAYIASNYQFLQNPINVTVHNISSSTVSSVHYPGIASANGAILFRAPGTSSPSTNKLTPSKDFVLFCDERTFGSPSALVALDPEANRTIPLINTFHGLNFAGVNDAKQHPVTGDVWFTDTY